MNRVEHVPSRGSNPAAQVRRNRFDGRDYQPGEEQP
jgi:hypothetical protein